MLNMNKEEIKQRTNSSHIRRTEYREVISLLRKGYSIRDVAKLSGRGVNTVQRVKRLKIHNHSNKTKFYVLFKKRGCAIVA